MDAQSMITRLERVPEDSTFVFRVRETETDEHREAILVRSDDGVVGWFNVCQHVTHVPLDKGDGATMRDGEIVCKHHGAYFDAGSGRCTFGPCEGAYLTELEVTVADGGVYLTDDDYEVVGPGPVPDDDHDRTSTSNVEF